MKIKLLFLCCILTTVKLYSQDTIYSWAYTISPVSNFEDRDTMNYFYFDSTQSNNTWQIGTPLKTTFNSAYTIPYALVTDTMNSYPTNNTSSFEFTIYTDDMTFISFWHRLDSDSLTDGGVVEISKDGGLTWTNVLDDPELTLYNFYTTNDSIKSNSNKPGFSGTSTWIQSTIQAYIMNFFRFRFTFTSDSIETNKDGWLIDSFEFTCWGTGIKYDNEKPPIYVSPNPTTNLIYVGTGNSSPFKQAKITDITGKERFITNESIIDLTSLQSGLYFVEVTTDSGNYIKRVIKQ